MEYRDRVQVGKPILLTFQVTAGYTVTARIQRSDDDSGAYITLPLPETHTSTGHPSVYTANYYPPVQGWYFVTYKAIGSSGDPSDVSTDATRFFAHERVMSEESATGKASASGIFNGEAGQYTFTSSTGGS